MAGKKNKPIKLDELTQEEKMKYEIAEELGLLDKVKTGGMEIAVIQGDRQNRRPDDEEKGGKPRKSNKNITNIN